MIRCQHCDSENVRIQGQATLSAPGELMHQFSKSNLRRKDVYLMGVNWETFDVICGDCSRVTPAYGNYVSRMEKEVERLQACFDQRNAAFIGSCKKNRDLQARVEELEGVVRDAHYEGYMAGVGDSEDYDHDPTVMEKEAWAEYEETDDE